MTRSSYYSKVVCNQEQVLMTQVGYTDSVLQNAMQLTIFLKLFKLQVFKDAESK